MTEPTPLAPPGPYVPPQVIRRARPAPERHATSGATAPQWHGHSG